MENRQIFSLLQINRSVARVIDQATKNRSFWIKTEITSINLHKRSGHYYAELADTVGGKTLAKAKAQIWSSTAEDMRRELGSDFDNILKQGSEVLILGQVKFHVQYGYSIYITRVDREFALGQIEAQKKECIEKLTKEGIIGRNQLVPVPMVIQHIIVIGSSGTAGVQDFEKQIKQNKYRYAFDYNIINVQVQGDLAKSALINAL